MGDHQKSIQFYLVKLILIVTNVAWAVTHGPNWRNIFNGMKKMIIPTYTVKQKVANQVAGKNPVGVIHLF